MNKEFKRMLKLAGINEIKINNPNIIFSKFKQALCDVLEKEHNDKFSENNIKSIIQSSSKDELLDRYPKITLGSDHDTFIDVLEAMERIMDFNLFKNKLINYYSKNEDSGIIDSIESSTDYFNLWENIDNYIYIDKIRYSKIIKDIFNIM
jgi:hypothetical protein